MKILNPKQTKNIKKDIEAILTTETTKSAKMTQLFELGIEIKEIAKSCVIPVYENYHFFAINCYPITIALLSSRRRGLRSRS